MIVKESEGKKQVRASLKGGKGDINFINFLNPDHMINCRLMSKMVLKPKTSVGEHVHISETEYYYILNGSGVVVDNGVEKEVYAGDLVVTRNGESHSVLNNGDNLLEILAIIVTE